MDEPEYLLIDEASDLLRTPVSTLYGWRHKQARLPAGSASVSCTEGTNSSHGLRPRTRRRVDVLAATHNLSKDYRHLVRAAQLENWEVRHKRRHLQLASPDGHTLVTVPGTPSDRRSYLNTRAALRRAGVQV